MSHNEIRHRGVCTLLAVLAMHPKEVYPRQVEHLDEAPTWEDRLSLWPIVMQDGAPKIANLPYFSGFMVDITIVNRGYNGL